MLDTLEIHIPILSMFVEKVGNLQSVVGEVAHYGLRAYGAIEFDVSTKTMKTLGVQKHLYERIASSYGGMSFKFMSHNVANTRPYVALKASAKFLQGHNIFGSESVQKLACHMLDTLKNEHPIFYQFLDIGSARICRIDATYSARLADEKMVTKALEFLRNVAVGHRRKDTDRRDFYNTVYWGGQTSRNGNAVAYGKHNDVIEFYKDFVKKANNGCSASSQYLESIFYDDLLEYSKGLLRFESRTKARLLVKMGLPTNLWAFIRYQKQNPNVLRELWQYWFKPIFKAMKGEVMTLTDDDKVRKLCDKHLAYKSKNGKFRYTKADNAYNFYKALKDEGFDNLRKHYKDKGCIRSFHLKVKQLVDIGLSLAVLQNAKAQDKEVPVISVIEFDFSVQSPNGSDLSLDDDENASYYAFDDFIYANAPPTDLFGLPLLDLDKPDKPKFPKSAKSFKDVDMMYS